MLTSYHGKYLSDPSFGSVLDNLGDRAVAMLVHLTSPKWCPTLRRDQAPPVLEFVFGTTRIVTDLLPGGSMHRHPNLRIVMPRGGTALPLLAERIQARSW